jgi:hypothetical protein
VELGKIQVFFLFFLPFPFVSPFPFWDVGDSPALTAGQTATRKKKKKTERKERKKRTTSSVARGLFQGWVEQHLSAVFVPKY